MKKLIYIMALFLLFSSVESFAFEEENIKPVGNYYELGTQYLKTDQYTKAISEFKKALRENPMDNSSKIQLTNAYLARAAYFNNKLGDYKNTALDLRSALFYMKYYDMTPVDAQTLNNIHITEGNLDSTLSAISADKSAKGRYESGKALRAQGEFAAAVTEFQSAQTDKNFRKDSLIALGEIYYIMNLNQQAANYLERALYDDPQNADAHLKLARVYERMGSTDKAAKSYNFALAKSTENQDILLSLENIWKQKISADPNDAEAHANLGAIYQKKGDVKLALQEYQTAERLNPSSVVTRLNLGTLFQQEKQYETAIEAYDSILKLYPNYMLAYYFKAQSLKAMGMQDAAIQNYKLALSLDPDNKNVQDELFELYKKDMSPEDMQKYMYNEVQNSPNDANKIYDYAFLLHKNKKLDDAIIYYNRAMKLDPNNPECYINLALAYKQKSQYQNALNIISQGKLAFPDNDEIKKQFTLIDAEADSVLYSSASALFNKKKYKEALELYKKITPETAETLVAQGACLQALNSNKSAITVYAKALALDSKNPDIMYYLAQAYANDNDNAQAMVYVEKSLDLKPGNPDAKALLTYLNDHYRASMLEEAVSFYEKKEYSNAFPLLEKVLLLNPNEATAYYYCALIYDEQKKYWPALDSYKKALHADPKMDIALYSIAVDYDYLGRYKEALTYYKKYVELVKADNEYTKYAKTRIQGLKKYETSQK